MTDKKNIPQKPIDVNGDITPISHVPVQSVDASTWHEASTADLSAQRATLQQRLMTAHQYSPHLVNQIQQGINRLDVIIKNRQPDDNSRGLI